MSAHILDKAYTITDPEGVAAGRVVVAGANPGQCALPAAANAGALLGVTTAAQTRPDAPVPVRKAGIALVAAAGPIAYGAPVNAAGASGKVKAVSETAGTKINCLGFAETAASADGDLIEVFISIHEREA
ncbi:MAG: hypothetical protein Kow0059_15790 [Candidatus Sumerlaeia bacterium]